MAKREKYIINIKNNNETKDILAFTYMDAINYIKIIDTENTDIRIYSENERLIYSQVNKKSREINQELQGQQVYQYHHNIVTDEKYNEELEDSYA